MGQYEQSSSEARHNPKPTEMTPVEYLRRELKLIEAEESRKKAHDEHQRKYGSKVKPWEIGIRDRLSASPYLPEEDYSEAERDSYEKGYINEGTRQIYISVTGETMTERASFAFYNLNDNNYDPEKYDFSSRKEFGSEYLDDFLYAVGYNDGLEGIINFYELPIEIQNNKSYKEGFFATYKEDNNPKKGR